MEKIGDRQNYCCYGANRNWELIHTVIGICICVGLNMGAISNLQKCCFTGMLKCQHSAGECIIYKEKGRGGGRCSGGGGGGGGSDLAAVTGARRDIHRRRWMRIFRTPVWTILLLM